MREVGSISMMLFSYDVIVTAIYRADNRRSNLKRGDFATASWRRNNGKYREIGWSRVLVSISVRH